MIPAAAIDEIRSRVNPVELIGRRVELRKAGTSFVGSCPFHSEKTPSFHVYPDSRRFKCFGCGARGDVFEFLKRFDGKDFRTVVRELAGEVGVVIADGVDTSLPVARGPGRPVAERACAAALDHWKERLWGEHGEGGRRYLATRGVEEATAKAFGIGLALDDWHDLGRELGARGFTDADLVNGGLLAKNEKGEPGVHDRFRGRIMFPICESGGRVVGFAGRSLANGGDAKGPKYLNSPETPIFRKGHLLFGHPSVGQAIRSARRVVLVEGYFDVIALHQAGIREVVAPGGTAVTEHQIGLLQRSGCEELVVLFDTDPAGLAAPLSVAPVLLRAGITTRVAELPGGPSDPDEFIRSRGARELSTALVAATPLTEWLLERAIARRTPVSRGRSLSVEEKLLVVRDLRPFVAACREGLPRALFEQRIARRLELYIIALRAELARERGGRGQGAGGGASWRG